MAAQANQAVPPSAAPGFYAAVARALAPRKPLTVSRWADAERRLSSKGSAEAGPWRTDRNPPLREPMDCMSARSTVREVALMFPIQFGKTEVAINALGYCMDHDPGPVMVCLPGEGVAPAGGNAGGWSGDLCRASATPPPENDNGGREPRPPRRLSCRTAAYQPWARTASSSRATMLVILMAGLTAGPAVSL